MGFKVSFRLSRWQRILGLSLYLYLLTYIVQ